MPFDFSNNNTPKTRPKADSGGLLPREPGSVSNSPLGGNKSGSSGFHNKPQQKTFSQTTSAQPVHTTVQRNHPPPPRPNVGRQKPPISHEIPWIRVLLIAAVVLAVVLLFVYRDAVFEFLLQIVVYAIIIIVLIMIIKRMIFGK